MAILYVLLNKQYISCSFHDPRQSVRTYVPRQTDGGGNPLGVIYTADEEELLDSERSAHERLLSEIRVNVRVITDEPSRYHQESERTISPHGVPVTLK